MRNRQRSMLGQLIRDARKAKGISSEELGKITQMAPSTIRSLEAGSGSRPWDDTLERLSKALDISIDDLTAASHGLVPPSQRPADEYTRESVAAEVRRIAAISGTDAKIKALKQLSPQLYDLVEGLVFDTLTSRRQQQLREEPPAPDDLQQDCLEHD